MNDNKFGNRCLTVTLNLCTLNHIHNCKILEFFMENEIIDTNGHQH